MLGRLNLYLARTSLFLIAAALIAAMAGCNYTPASPNPEIRTWYDLDAVRDNLDGNYTLMNDLDSTTAGYVELASPTANGGRGWEPIGTESQFFTGSFDGQGYEIRDLFINRPDEDAVGLFGDVSQSGAIKNTGVTNATVIGHDYAGGLAGLNEGIVGNSYSNGSVTGNWYVGGLTGGNNEGTVTDSYSIGNVTGVDNVGGLVGWNTGGNVSNCFWDTQTSGQATSDGGTGKNTTQMQDITTFSGAAWNITAVALNETSPAYIWNIVSNVTYPFLSWQPV
jgi:hypothetical protein